MLQLKYHLCKGFWDLHRHNRLLCSTYCVSIIGHRLNSESSNLVKALKWQLMMQSSLEGQGPFLEHLPPPVEYSYWTLNLVHPTMSINCTSCHRILMDEMVQVRSGEEQRDVQLWAAFQALKWVKRLWREGGKSQQMHRWGSRGKSALTEEERSFPLRQRQLFNAGSGLFNFKILS